MPFIVVAAARSDLRNWSKSKAELPRLYYTAADDGIGNYWTADKSKALQYTEYDYANEISWQMIKTAHTHYVYWCEEVSDTPG